MRPRSPSEWRRGVADISKAASPPVFPLFPFYGSLCFGMAKTGFEVLRVEAPAGLEEELVARLWSLGSTGSWSEPGDGPDRVRIHVFFEAGSISHPLDLGSPRVLSVEGPEPVPERDWLAEWRAAAVPIPVGRRFLVDPRDPDGSAPPVDPGDRILLRLPARTAFGVGSHESTRLALELLEQVDPRGRRVLDVGTGTGILAFAALHLGAREVVAFDVDPAAALLLPQLMELNGLRFPAFAGSASNLSTGGDAAGRAEASCEGKGAASSGRFDLATVNVVPSEIRQDLPRLAAVLRPGGSSLFSGILCSELDEAIAGATDAGFRETLRGCDGEWCAFAAEVVG